MNRNHLLVLFAFVFLIWGLIAILRPDLVYDLILTMAFFAALFNGCFLAVKTFRHFGLVTLLLAVLSLTLAVVLFFYRGLPEWLIRLCFGLYCLLVSVSLLGQQLIYFYNQFKLNIGSLILMIMYGLLSFLLLLSPRISSMFLMRCFGVYFILLSFRYIQDYKDLRQKNYHWKRQIHISLPAVILAIIPEWSVRSYNSLVNKNLPPKQIPVKDFGQSTLLQVMVHVGDQGFSKVGHFTFSYKGIVYSYGNYDKQTERLGGLFGDGVYFCAPKDLYLQHICKDEKNTIFEYGIYLTKHQQEMVEKALEKLRDNSRRWYCPLERLHLDQKDYSPKDYASKVHYRTGAKFYKPKRGRFKTYYLLGDNCVMFADQIIGTLGADVLSIRGIVSPGAYFNYLKEEAKKDYSPVTDLGVHPMIV